MTSSVLHVISIVALVAGILLLIITCAGPRLDFYAISIGILLISIQLGILTLIRQNKEKKQ